MTDDVRIEQRREQARIEVRERLGEIQDEVHCVTEEINTGDAATLGSDEGINCEAEEINEEKIREETDVEKREVAVLDYAKGNAFELYI